jgi:hypothetical protein
MTSIGVASIGVASIGVASIGVASIGVASIVEPNIVIEYNDTDYMQHKNNELQKENESLLKRIEELETRLKKYTNGDNHKRYYEKNKQKIKETGTAYLQKLKAENPDKLKEYSHSAYERKKLKKKLAEEKTDNA